MNNGLTYNSGLTVFRKWSGKAYSVFASIGRQIRIGHIDFDICDKALLKDKKGNPFLLDINEFLVDKDEDTSELLDEVLDYQLIFNLLTIKSEDSLRHYCRIFTYLIFKKNLKHYNVEPKNLLSKSGCYNG